MNTRIIDAYIILRYILKDNDNFEIAKSEILKGATTDITILVEVVYVLKGVYKISREETVGTLVTISEEIEYENIETLLNFKNKNLDFADCYLLARKRIFQDEIITFDKKLNNKLNK